MKQEIKRYNMAIPQALYDELETIANNETTTVLEIMKRFIKAGLCLYKISTTDGGEITIKAGKNAMVRRLMII